MITKTYFAQYPNAQERAVALERYHSINAGFFVSNDGMSGLARYKIQGIEAELVEGKNSDLTIVVSASGELIDPFVKEMQSPKFLNTPIILEGK